MDVFTSQQMGNSVIKSTAARMIPFKRKKPLFFLSQDLPPYMPLYKIGIDIIKRVHHRSVLTVKMKLLRQNDLTVQKAFRLHIPFISMAEPLYRTLRVSNFKPAVIGEHF